jgi:N-acetylmuramoyl-L-alanine amidase
MKKFMLDAGHGYQTIGKGVPGMKEYEFNKAVVNYMIDDLQRYENVVLYSCYSDTRDVPLKERTDLANKLGVDVYVSVHGNAASDPNANGIETFVHPSRSAKSLALANRVQGNLIYLTGLRNRGVKTADFHVLRESHMDAILVECGFMTNPNDLALMKSEDYRQKCAIAISDALRDEYGLKLKPQPVPVAQPKPAPAPTEEATYRIVTGSFSDRANADQRIAELKNAGFDSFIEVKK